MNVLVKTSFIVDNVDSQQIIMAGVLSEAETAYHLRPTGFISDLFRGRVSHFSVLSCAFVLCLSSSSVLCAQCCQCHFSIVYLTLQVGIVA